LFLGVGLGGLQAATRALVVGVDDYEGRLRLKSCVNDAREFEKHLTRRAGVPADNVRILVNKSARRADILRELERMMRLCDPDDQFIFFFSGHGTILPTASAGARVAKAMVPFCRGEVPAPADCLSQDEFKAVLDRRTDVRKVVILDCCHAGSATRTTGKRPEPGAVPKYVDVGFDPAVEHLGKEVFVPMEVEQSKSAPSGEFLWLGACESRQVAWSATPNSYFTAALLEELKSGSDRSVSEYFQKIIATVSEKSRSQQTPQIEGNSRRPLIVPKVLPSPASASPERLRDSSMAGSGLTSHEAIRWSAEHGYPVAETDFQIQVTVAKSHYKNGEKLLVTVNSPRSCFIRIYSIDAKTDVFQLFPNESQTNNFIAANVALTFPKADDEYEWVLGEPFGHETIVVVGQTEQFQDLIQPKFVDGYVATHGMQLGETLSRGVHKTKKRPGNPDPVSLTQSNQKANLVGFGATFYRLE
jgi:hypothetical protein